MRYPTLDLKTGKKKKTVVFFRGKTVVHIIVLMLLLSFNKDIMIICILCIPLGEAGWCM